MKTKTLLTALATTMAVSFGISASAVTLKEIQDRGTVRIAVANEIPYGYMDMSGKAKGAGPEVAQHIMDELGIKKVEWITTNFGSLIPGLRANRFDMVAAEMAILPQRCKEVLFSEPDTSYGEGLLVAKGNPDDIHTFESFAKNDKKIAIMAGADQLEMLQELGVSEDRMVTIASNADAISTVATGRASAYAATSLTVSELAKKSDKVEPAADFTDPVIGGKPARSWGGFTFNQGSEDFRDAVNGELKKFKQTPEWKKILETYGFSEADAKESFSMTTEQLCAAK
ncbi:ectoine/hydroxyectoine ABC transporter substrate-binding protein EhuB [Pusillimonas sp. ANT_WB101]|uniref:ectoine/hydroxyectoine ABC transporter substrate-binding protein EhuB n=1 Tax=Pusillimonas sp. ANT_WB101 TaxID=2597356 RepID=UPI0011ED6617|nr:ectoine/hydroxyectoine ABC transporter substrate-binding protein EhuB [Pusillimonas sp. ANT_WB101]KAA0911868.1 ectoine/hydroxyectoine ABC transporter substrate-binding protein EhuB [Pusillimonas sp. ANT_WB101]